MIVDIGQWVRRDRPGTKWHLVESIIADAAITKCGRRMEPQTTIGDNLEVSEVTPFTRLIDQPQLCRSCYGTTDRTLQ